MNRLLAQDVMSHPVVSVHPETPLTEVATLLRERRISGVPVVNRLGHLLGIVTEGDFLWKEANAGGPEAFRGSRAQDLMSKDVVARRPDAPLKDLAAVMARLGINRIPIVLGGHVVGIVTRADVLKAFDRTDESLVAEIRQRLLEDLHIDPDSLRITVENRAVTMSGVVPDAFDIRLVETVLGQIDGIADVDVSGLGTHAATA